MTPSQNETFIDGCPRFLTKASNAKDIARDRV